MSVTEQLSRFVRGIERRGASPWTPFAAAAWIAGIRMTLEYVWVAVPRGVRREPLVWFGHVESFYLALILSISALLILVTRRDAPKVTAAVAAGLVLGILPPLIDVAIYGAGQFNYEYAFALEGVPWLLYSGPMTTPVGEAVTLWLSVLILATYVRLTTGSWWRTLVAALGHYLLILFYLVVLPNAALVLHATWREISANEALALLLTCACLVAFLIGRGLVRHLLNRIAHPLLAPCLVALATAATRPWDAHAMLACVALFLCAVVFTLQNDFYDAREDAAAGRASLVVHDDVVVSSSLLIGLGLTLGLLHFWVSAAGLLFLIVGMAYHADPYRLKCTFPLSYKTEALLAGCCFIAGALSVPVPHLLPGQGVMLLVAALGASVVAIVKDRKDVAADNAAQVRTLYVVLQRRGVSPEKTDRIVIALFGGCMAVPIVYLVLAGATPLATAMALCCAGLSFFGLLGLRDLVVGTRVALLGLSGFILAVAGALWSVPAAG